MSRSRSQGLFAVGLGLAAAACSDPDLQTDLRPAGPPEVLTVLAQHPIDLTEAAVYCKYVGDERDPKAPGFVGDPLTGGGVICPPTKGEFAAAELEPRPFLTLNAAGMVIDNQPWGLRVMFDELLDGDRVETLVPPVNSSGTCDDGETICSGSLDDTQPFTLTCGAMNTAVAYTGHYTPNGNNTTFPLGPSLYLQPDPAALTFPTGSICTLGIDGDVVVDKEGNSVPATDQSFDVKLADLALLAVDPADDDEATISPDPVAAGAAAFVFNANIDDAVADPAMFQLKDGDGNDLDTAIFVGAYYSAGLTDAVYVYPDTATGIFAPGDYSATMLPGTIAEVNGGTLEVTTAETTHFSVAFGKTGNTSGTDLATNGVMRVSFNNTLDPTTVTADDLEFFQTNPVTTPPNMAVPAAIAVGNSTASGNANGVALNNVANNAIVVTPTSELPIGTYVLRIKAGAEVKDTAAMPHTATFAAPFAITYNVLLKATHSIPANAGNLAAASDFRVVFSGTLDFTTVTADDFELIDTTAGNAAVPFTIGMETSTPRPAPAPGSHANDTVLINPTANLVVGHVYTLTIKNGAVIKSGNGVSRTFGAASTSASNRTTWTFTAN